MLSLPPPPPDVGRGLTLTRDGLHSCSTELPLSGNADRPQLLYGRGVKLMAHRPVVSRAPPGLAKRGKVPLHHDTASLTPLLYGKLALCQFNDVALNINNS